MAKHEKPKAASKISRNADRRNGKAYKKNCNNAATTAPGTPCKGERGGRFGYSRKRLAAMAAAKGVSIMTIEDQLREKLLDRADRAKLKPKNSAARPGIGEVTYKMTSVNRHFDKRRPYPCVPKGSAHAGKPEKQTDTEQRKADRTARRNGGKAQIMEVQAALRMATAAA